MNLDNTEGICHWEVHKNSKNKILTTEAEDLSEEKIIEVVQKAGFKIKTLNL